MTCRFFYRHNWSSCLAVRFAVIVAIALLILTGCGRSRNSDAPAAMTPVAVQATEQTADDATEAAPAPAAEPTVEPTAVADTPEATVQSQTGVITVAVNANFRPFIYMDESGKLAGFDVDLMNALSAAGNFETAFVDRPFEGMLTDLAAGEYDAAISAITINELRMEQVNFTDPYFEPGQATFSFYSSGLGIGVRSSETAINSQDDLQSLSIVGVKQGTTGDEFASTFEDVQVVRFGESNEALDALVSGAVDAVLMDVAVITDYIKQGGSTVKLVGGPVTDDVYGIAVNKERGDVLEMLNDALAQVREDGTYDQLVAKWFSAP